MTDFETGFWVGMLTLATLELVIAVILLRRVNRRIRENHPSS